MTHEFAPPFIDWKKALSGVRKYKSFWFFKRFVLLLRSQFFAKKLSVQTSLWGGTRTKVG